MEVMRLSYEKSINLLKAKGIEFETGLTGVEMEKIESTYKIEFPKSLKMFLMAVLPVSLTEEERNRGLITASAGNHAQGVAFAAREFGCKATIVMPTAYSLVSSSSAIVHL